MTDLLQKMEALVRKDFETNSSVYIGLEMKSCALINGNTEAQFIVKCKLTGTWLYNVIHYQECNEFRVIRYKYVGMYEVYAGD